MNNIPQFLAHLPIWKSEPINENVKNIPKANAKKLGRPKKDPPKKTCVVCGHQFEVKNHAMKTQTCGRACGYQLSMLKKRNLWDYKNNKPMDGAMDIIDREIFEE